MEYCQRPKQQQKNVFLIFGIEIMHLLVILVGISTVIIKDKHCRDWGAILKYALTTEDTKDENDLTLPMVGSSGLALRIFISWCKSPLG
jgi:hypothetical protein